MCDYEMERTGSAEAVQYTVNQIKRGRLPRLPGVNKTPVSEGIEQCSAMQSQRGCKHCQVGAKSILKGDSRSADKAKSALIATVNSSIPHRYLLDSFKVLPVSLSLSLSFGLCVGHCVIVSVSFSSWRLSLGASVRLSATLSVSFSWLNQPLCQPQRLSLLPYLSCSILVFLYACISLLLQARVRRSCTLFLKHTGHQPATGP